MPVKFMPRDSLVLCMQVDDVIALNQQMQSDLEVSQESAFQLKQKNEHLAGTLHDAMGKFDSLSKQSEVHSVGTTHDHA